LPQSPSYSLNTNPTSIERTKGGERDNDLTIKPVEFQAVLQLNSADPTILDGQREWGLQSLVRREQSVSVPNTD